MKDYKQVKLEVKKWTQKSKYPCPECGNKLGMPEYKCEPCKIIVKPYINMKFG